MLIPDPEAGCSLADSITAEQLRDWKARHPGAIVVMYVNTTRRGQGRDRLLLHLGQRGRGGRAHPARARRRTPRSCSAPTCSWAPTSRRRSGGSMHVWDGECHVHAGIRPSDIAAVRAAHPGADFLIHPECGCSTSVMEYVAAGDIDAERGAHALDRRDAPLRRASTRAEHRDRRHRDRDAPPAAPGRPGGTVHRRQRGGALPLHEDDHAAQAARLAARRGPRGEGPGRGRRPGAAWRSSGWSRSARPVRSSPRSAVSRTARSVARLRSNSAGV